VVVVVVHFTQVLAVLAAEAVVVDMELVLDL
jgi:hypothetical protein